MSLFIPDQDGAESLPDLIIHNDCGLPVELCVCTDAPVKADGDAIADLSQGRRAATRIGETIAINLDVAGGEDEARRLMEAGWKVRVVSLQTSEVECPACGWGSETTLYFDCKLGIGGEPPSFMNCPGCSHPIELSIELLNMMRRAYDGKI